MTIYLIRHGETIEKGFNGVTESQLSSRGGSQIKSLQPFFNNKKIDEILSSPRERTKETAGILNCPLKVRIKIDIRLAEINFGCWEGKEFKQIEQESPEKAARFLKHVEDFEFPEGNNIKDFCKKADETWKELKGIYTGKNIIIVSHCVWLKAVLRNYFGLEFLISGNVPHAALYEVDLEKNIATQEWGRGGE